MSGRNSRESRRRAIEQARQREARRRRRLRLAAWGGAAVVLAGAGTGIGLGVSGGPWLRRRGSGGGLGHGRPASYAALSTLGTLTTPPAAGALGPESVPVPDAPVARWHVARDGRASHRRDRLQHQRADAVPHPHAPDDLRERAAAPGPGRDRHPERGGARRPGGAVRRVGHVLLLAAHARGRRHHPHRVAGERTYTLGDFFDEWGQPLGPAQVGPARGHGDGDLNGKVFKGNPRDVPLGSRENLQLEVGAPLVAPETINWSVTGL